VKCAKKATSNSHEELGLWRRLKVKADEDGMRLDRWVHVHYPTIPNSLIHKLLRQKKVPQTTISN
jgi:hypothetical protein